MITFGFMKAFSCGVEKVLEMELVDCFGQVLKVQGRCDWSVDEG